MRFIDVSHLELSKLAKTEYALKAFKLIHYYDLFDIFIPEKFLWEFRNYKYHFSIKIFNYALISEVALKHFKNKNTNFQLIDKSLIYEKIFTYVFDMNYENIEVDEKLEQGDNGINKILRTATEYCHQGNCEYEILKVVNLSKLSYIFNGKQ
jgi:hypothetical protein